MTSKRGAGDILDLPDRLYLDTQFAVAYLVAEDRDHEAALLFGDRLERVARDGLTAVFISLLLLNELAWALAGFLHDRAEGPGAWRRIGHTEKRRSYLGRRVEVAEILRSFAEELWITPVPHEKKVIQQFLLLLPQQPLCPADICHLAEAVTNHAGGIVTSDTDFQDVAGLPMAVVRY